MRSPFPRVGGKKLLKKRIVKLFPKDYSIYCEPFCGASSVFFEKPKSGLEILNDKDKVVYNILKLFKTYDGQEISKAINGTYSRKEFEAIMQSKPRTFENKALKSLLISKISFRANMTNYSQGKSKISTHYSDEYMERLKNVTLLNQSYEKVIKKYDSPSTFFYIDPPYENSEGDYTHDFVDPQELCKLLSSIKGMFLLSYNDSDNIREIFKSFNIRSIKTMYSSMHGTNTNVKELLISNYTR